MAISISKVTNNLKFFKAKNFPRKLQPYFLQVLSELLAEGFSLKQSLNFMEILLLPQQSYIQQVALDLERGQTIEQSLRPLGFSLAVVAQLFYGQRQGRFIPALEAVSQQLAEQELYRKKLTKVLIYPLFLALFLVLMLFGVRSFMLPNIASFITQEHYDQEILVRLLVDFFTYLPQLALGGLAFILLFYGGLEFFLLRKPALQRYQILVKFPLVKRWVRQYCSYKIAGELGYFFAGGYSIQQTVQIILAYPIDPLLTDIAGLIQAEMFQGVDLPEIITKLAIFTLELPMVIYQGELTSQTAQKCKLYSRKIYRDLMDDIQAKMALVQPILFIIIGLLVMAMYLVMMLPMLTMQGI